MTAVDRVRARALQRVSPKEALEALQTTFEERLQQHYGVHLVIDGCPPGWGAKNRKFKGRHAKVLSDEYKTFQDYTWIAWMNAKQPRLETGGIEIVVHVYWKRKRTFDDGYETGFGDVDAVSSAVLDALQDKRDKKGNLIEQRCIDNDMRVVQKTVRKFVDKQHPRVEVWLRQV